jgi:hypothetical protein
LKIWATNSTGEFKELKIYINRLVEECGAFPNIQGIDEWFKFFYETQEMPLLIHSVNKSRMPFGIGKLRNEKYIALRESNGKTYVTNQEIKIWLDSLTWEEKWDAGLDGFSDNLYWIAPLAMSVGLLLLLFSPTWIPHVHELMRGKSGKGYWDKEKMRVQVIKLYNCLNNFKAALSGPLVKKSWANEALFLNEFSQSRVFKKHFSRREKSRFNELKTLLSKNGDEALLLKNSDSFDLLMKRCDHIIDRLC